MKKIFLLLFVSTFAFISCDESVDEEIYTGDSLTYFTNGTNGNFFVEETNDPGFKIPVGVTDKVANDRIFTVSVVNEQTTATEAEYMLDETFVIPANEHIGYINVTGFFNEIDLTGSVLAIKLESIDGSNIANFDNIYTLKLNPFCPFDVPTSFNGTAAIVGQGTVNSFTVELEPTGNLNEFTTESIWGDFVAGATGDPSYAGEYPYSGVLNIDCLGNVTFVSQEGQLPGGTGTYDEITGTLTIVLDQELFTNPFQVEVVLTPAN
ncbi:DUF4843 domain-containing protein [Psychroflexus halocasei]|uniref:DUF4843 domain-containing protein n=1 Tax=Psychroflexus halocasei TaxID=908615 RepID=A0A1H3VHX6_9FLAO|nr:DUF4843 domain-containing protein [Psychroflexus halocasei]SDZ74375.1 protein of unknown function [Psychroflexus halocasei]